MTASRGYCGYHNGMYLRSMREYAYALYLDSNNIIYNTEVNTYTLNNETFKPDFFIYDINNNLIKIVEVKYHISQYTKKEDWKLFFYNMGIEYEIQVINNLNKFVYDNNLDIDRINLFKLNSHVDYSGVNNPRYGQHCTEETKFRIVNNRNIDNFNYIIKQNGLKRRGIKCPHQTEYLNILYSDVNRKNKLLTAIRNGKQLDTETRRVIGKLAFNTLRNSGKYNEYVEKHRYNTSILWTDINYRNKVIESRNKYKYTKGLISFINRTNCDISMIIDVIINKDEKKLLDLKRQYNFTNAKFKCISVLSEFSDKEELLTYINKYRR